MPNVRLRTIINQDNSTTFQVQFQQGGEWEDLTWDMISNKPFETLDDTVFLVDENGVLTITDVPTVCGWADVTDKPFISLNPDDFSVDENGVLSYIGSTSWVDLTGKPFSTVDNNDFIVVNGELQIRPKTVECDWSNVDDKPFSYLDSDDFTVENDVLKVNFPTPPSTTPDWDDVTNKPFNSLDSDDFTVNLQGELSVNFPTPTPDDWDDVTGKPFETLNGTDFSVDADGEVSVNFPTPPTPTPDDWDDITNKPFETLGSDFSVDGDGELSVNFPTPTPDDWDDVTNKPFESIGSGLSVDSDGVLSASGGGGNPDWTDVQNKPFNYIGTGLYTYDGKLMNRYFTYIKKTMPQNYIANLTVLKYFIQNMLRSALANRLNVAGSIVFDYYPLLLEGASNYMYLNLRIDNTQTGLTQFSDSYEVMVEAEFYRSQEGSSEDKFMIAYRVNGMPLLDSSNVAKKYMIEGIAQYRAAKTDGVYTSVNYDNTSMGMCSECNSFSISTGSVN